METTCKSTSSSVNQTSGIQHACSKVSFQSSDSTSTSQNQQSNSWHHGIQKRISDMGPTMAPPRNCETLKSNNTEVNSQNCPILKRASHLTGPNMRMPSPYCIPQMKSIPPSTSMSQSFVQNSPGFYMTPICHPQNYLVLPRRMDAKPIQSRGTGDLFCIPGYSKTNSQEILRGIEQRESRKLKKIHSSTEGAKNSSKSDSMEAIINKQRKLIAQLVKIIVKDRLQSHSSHNRLLSLDINNQDPYPADDSLTNNQAVGSKPINFAKERNDEPNTIATLCTPKSAEGRRQIGKNEQGQRGTARVENETDSNKGADLTHEIYESVSHNANVVTSSPGKEYIDIASGNSDTSSKVNLLEKKSTLSDIEISKLHERTMDLCAENEKSVLSRLRSEFDKELSSLKQEMYEDEQYYFSTLGHAIANRKEKSSEAGVPTIEQNNRDKLSQDSAFESESGSLRQTKQPGHYYKNNCQTSKGNEIILIHDDDSDNNILLCQNTLATPQTPTKEELITVQFGSDSNIHSDDNVGNSKRRRKPSVNTAVEIDNANTRKDPSDPNKEQNQEKETEYYFRRSPRKRCKRVTEKYIRRSASKQARKKIINQLKTSDSEFSPSSCSERASGNEESRKTYRRKLLPPKLYKTFDGDDEPTCDIADKVHTQCHTSKFNSPPMKEFSGEKNSCIHKEQTDQATEKQENESVVDLTASDSNDAFNWVIPRSVSSSTLLPCFENDFTRKNSPSVEAYEKSCNIFQTCHPSNIINSSSTQNIRSVTFNENHPLDLTSSPLKSSQAKNTIVTSIAIVEDDVQPEPLDLSFRPVSSDFHEKSMAKLNNDSYVMFAPCPDFANISNLEYDNVALQQEHEILQSQNTHHNKSVSFTHTAQPCLYDKENYKTEAIQEMKRVEGKHVNDQQCRTNLPGNTKSGDDSNENDQMPFNHDLQVTNQEQNDDMQLTNTSSVYQTWDTATNDCSRLAYEEFDFTENPPPEISLKCWLSRRKKFPSSLFSLAKGHGIGFLRRQEARGLTAGSASVGSTIDSLRKVSKAKTIWRKLARDGKLREYIAPSVNTRGSRNRIHKQRALLGISSIENDSSRQDESPDEIIGNKVKKLRKRRDFKRSYLAKQVSKARKTYLPNRENTPACTDQFPFTACVSNTEESSGVDYVSESSPSLSLNCDESTILTSLHMNLMSKYMSANHNINDSSNVSPMKTSACVTEDNSHKKSFVEKTQNKDDKPSEKVCKPQSAISVQDGSGDFHKTEQQQHSSEKSIKQVNPKKQKQGQGHSGKNHKRYKKGKPGRKPIKQNKIAQKNNDNIVEESLLEEKKQFANTEEIDQELPKNNQNHSNGESHNCAGSYLPPLSKNLKPDICHTDNQVKEEYISDEDTPCHVSETIERVKEVANVNDEMPLLQQEGYISRNISHLIKNLSTDCIVPISPMKYHKSGQKWVKNSRSSQVNAKSPLTKTFFKCKTECNDTYQVRDSDDTQTGSHVAKPAKSTAQRKCIFDNSDSEQMQDPEANIAEWTMLPRKACSKAKQKISQLSKTTKRQKNSPKFAIQPTTEEKNIEDNDGTDDDELPPVPWLN